MMVVDIIVGGRCGGNQEVADEHNKQRWSA
jgi:hypothetical protein